MAALVWREGPGVAGAWAGGLAMAALQQKKSVQAEAHAMRLLSAMPATLGIATVRTILRVTVRARVQAACVHVAPGRQSGRRSAGLCVGFYEPALAAT